MSASIRRRPVATVTRASRRPVVTARAVACLAVLASGTFGAARADAQTYSLAQLKGYPVPSELAAAARASRIAWAVDERGRRNVYVAEAPDFRPRMVTAYAVDDGQEITSVQLSDDGRWVVFARGGEHSANWEGPPPNPLSLPTAPRVQVIAVPFAGGAPKVLADGDEPRVSPTGDVVVFERDRALWVVPTDGSAQARRLVSAGGTLVDATWSPDGSRLAFVANRGDHSFIGIYADSTTPIRWLAPSTSRDGMPRWSNDGTRLAFVRRPGVGGAPDSVLVPRHVPWSIWVADVATGQGRVVWTAPRTLRGSVPGTHGGPNLNWGAGDRLVFLSEEDGWPHLYAVGANGGAATLLTPGAFMVEHVTLSPDRTTLVASANTGPDAKDLNRRHVLRVRVDGSGMRVLTPGSGLEWMPVVLGDNATVACFGATAQRPAVAMVMGTDGANARLVGEGTIPADFPASQLVTPEGVTFPSTAGLTIHGQLFRTAAASGRRPAVIFVHGGPPRQMLLGWHYSDYYANTYAVNQYLASRGFVVLSVNYRLGIGYGRDFQHPRKAGAQGASEYDDVVAAARYLRSRPDVDASRIGIWGGSYGGFLTAMALAKNSDLFATGVDVHGVHDWTSERARGLLAFDKVEQFPDRAAAIAAATASSPITWVGGWRSPVLFIHGDDDRNVRFSQTVDLVQRVAKRGVSYEELVIPDDTHHFLRHANSLRVDSAATAYLEKKLRPVQP
ncbi:MAG: S9 family peptidase [Gemmatimonadetes bacterium]|nr:S9 family peptidase [Gemmatimonadota bacterium]